MTGPAVLSSRPQSTRGTPPGTRSHHDIGPHREGEVLVMLRPDFGAVGSDFCQDYGLDLLEKVPLGSPGPGLANGAREEFLHLKLPAGLTTEQALDKLQDDPRVAYATPNTLYQQDVLPNDMSAELYGLVKIQAPAAWGITRGSRTGPIVAVLDAGVDTTHPDLRENLWVNRGEIPGNGIDDDRNGVVDDIHGYNAGNGSGDPKTLEAHGTHCAGIIGAVGNNGQGVVGVNWEAQIMGINIFGMWGADAVSISKALSYAGQMGARIASCSFGGGVFNPIVYEAFKSSPMLHICAAGNAGKDVGAVPHYPASFDLPNIVSVAATDNRDNLARFSNYNSHDVDLAAPGVDIKSTIPGGYEALSGTSMATPYVSGVAALIATAFPTATPAQIKARLLANTDAIPGLATKVSTGGRLNALKALEADEVPPGAVANFKASAQGSRQVNLSWRASGDDGSRGAASFYELRYADIPIVDGPSGPGQVSFDEAPRQELPRPKDSGGSESATISLMPASEARRVYTALKAVDNVGNLSSLSTAKCDLPAARLALDISAGSREDWTGDGTWGVTHLPGIGSVWTDSPRGEYGHNLDMSLTSKPFSLKGMRGSKLVFESKYSIEREKDSMNIEVTDNGGKTWTTVNSFSGDGHWGIREVDLGQFDNRGGLQLRFRLKTDATGTRDGISLGRTVVAAS